MIPALVALVALVAAGPSGHITTTQLSHSVAVRSVLAVFGMARNGSIPMVHRGAGGVVVRGTVSDQSKPAHPPVADVPLLLQVRQGSRIVASIQSRSDTHGAFALALPETGRGISCRLVARYHGVSYDTVLDPSALSRSVRVAVYETTADDTGLAAVQVQIGMTRLRTRRLAVAEQWTFTNPVTLTDAGRDGLGHRSALFPLPPHAEHAQILGTLPASATATVGRDGVAFNSIIRPATGLNADSFYQVKFAFELPITATHPTLLVPTRYMIMSLQVFALGSRLIAPGFQRATIQVGTQRLAGWETQLVQPGHTVAIGVDGPPAVPASVAPAITGQPQTPGFPLTSVATLIGGGFALLLLLGLTRPVGPAATPRDRLDAQRERARLIGAIAALDLQAERGAIAPSEYRDRRASAKRRLLDVARSLGL